MVVGGLSGLLVLKCSVSGYVMCLVSLSDCLMLIL